MCLQYAVYNRGRRAEVKIENGLATVAVRDHEPPGVRAVTDNDYALRDLSGQPLNAISDRDSGGVNGRHGVGNSLGMRLRGGGLVLGGKGEHSYFLALLIRLSAALSPSKSTKPGLSGGRSMCLLHRVAELIVAVDMA